MTNWNAMSKGRNEWYLAPSLIALGNEINARWPNRDTASDGAIGDASHQARTSDHNPDWSAGGVVRAIDVDNNGIDVQELLDATIRDQRVWYVIWNRHIYSRTYGWAKRAYDGADPHTGHVHISINHTKAAETDVSRWFAGTTTPPNNPEDEMTPAQMTELKNFIEDNNQKYAVACNTYTRQILSSTAKTLLTQDAATDKAQADRIVAALDAEAKELSDKILAAAAAAPQ